MTAPAAETTGTVTPQVPDLLELEVTGIAKSGAFTAMPTAARKAGTGP